MAMLAEGFEPVGSGVTLADGFEPVEKPFMVQVQEQPKPTLDQLRGVLNQTNPDPNVDQEASYRGQYMAFIQLTEGRTLTPDEADSRLKASYGGSASNAVTSLKKTYAVEPLGEEKKHMVKRSKVADYASGFAGGVAQLLPSAASGLFTADLWLRKKMEPLYKADSKGFEKYQALTRKIELFRETAQGVGDSSYEFWVKNVDDDVKKSIGFQASSAFGQLPLMALYLNPVGAAAGTIANIGRMADEGYQAAKENGKTEEQALNIGVGVGTVNGILESVVDRMTAGIGSDVVQLGKAGSKEFFKNLLKTGAKGQAVAGVEAFTEAVQSAVTQKAATGEIDGKQALTEGFLGYVTATLSGGVFGAVNLSQANKLKSEVIGLGLKEEEADKFVEDLKSAKTEEERKAVSASASEIINERIGKRVSALTAPVQTAEELQASIEERFGGETVAEETPVTEEGKPVLTDRPVSSEDWQVFGREYPTDEAVDAAFEPSEQTELFKKGIRGDASAQQQFNQNNSGTAPVVEEQSVEASPAEPISVPDATGWMAENDPIESQDNARRTRSRVMNRVMTPFIELVGDVSQELKSRITRFEFGVHQRKKAYFDESEAAIEAINNVSKTDKVAFNDLEYALNNRDFLAAEKIIGKDAVDIIRKRTEQLADDLDSVGYNVARSEGYFPRRVKDLDGLRDAVGSDTKTLIDQAILEQQKKAEENGYVLSDMEIEKIINNVLTGSYHPVGGRVPRSMKQRTIDEVTTELGEFYYDTIDSWIMYNNEVAEIVELRKLLGKDIEMSGDVVNMNESLGKIVAEMRESEGFSARDEGILRGALKARFGYRPTGKGGQAYRSLAAMTTLGQLTSSLTQIGDFTWSFYENGLFDTVGGASDVISGSGVTMKDLGLDSVSEEFSSPKGLSLATDYLFKYSGLKAIDRLGKETLINSALREYQAGAKSGKIPTAKQEKLDALFGKEQGAVLEDLKNGTMSDDVKLLMFSTALDWHPLTLSNMPIAYLNHPTGRILYTLKTFTVKQLDNFRRVAVDDLIEGVATKDMRLAAHGFGKLMRLAGIMLACNIPIDMLKDWLTGKNVSLTDSTLDNLFKLVGFSRFSAERVMKKGQKLSEIMWKTVSPVTPYIDMPAEDIKYAIDQLKKGDEIDMMDLESWQMVPFVGRGVYYRYGKGKEREEKRLKEKNKSKPSGSQMRVLK